MSSIRLRYLARPSVVIPDLQISGDPDLTGVEGSPYSSGPIVAAGGKPPYTFAVNYLPPGATLNSLSASSVEIAGTLTTPGLTEDIVVSVTDARGEIATLPPFDIDVTPIPETVDYLVTSRAELIDTFAIAKATGVAKVIGVEDGDWTATDPTIIDLRSQICAARITIRGMTQWGAKLPGFDLEGSTNIRIEELELYRSRTVGGSNLAGVNRLHSTINCSLRNNLIHSDPLASADFTGYMAVSGGNGVAFIDGENVTTTGGGTGVFRIRPRSSSSIVAITGSDPGTTCSGYVGGANSGGGGFKSPEGSPKWYGFTLTGSTSGATRVIGDVVSDVEFLSGIATGSTGTQATNLEVIGNTIHDVKRGIQVGGPGLVIHNNYMHDVYVGGWDITGDFDNLDIKDNEVFGIWALDTDGRPSGTNGPHSGLNGLSATSQNIDNMSIVGERGSVGRNRYNALGAQAFATAPKMNDGGANITGSISGTTLTVTANSSNWTIRVGHRLVNTNLVYETRIEEQLTGTPGGLGTYRLNNSQTVSSQSLQIQARYRNSQIKSCLWECNGAIALEVDFAADIDVIDTQVVSCRDSQISLPAIYPANLDAGCRFWGCVANNYNIPATVTTGLGNYGVDPETYDLSANNISVLLNATSGPASYEENFMGVGGATPFSGATRENFLQMWTPKPGGPVAVAGIGPFAHYDFATGEGSYPTFTKAAATEATGVDLPRVSFGTGVYARYTVSPNTLPIMGMSRGDVMTFITQVKVLGDANGYLFGAAGSGFAVRRQAASSRNRLRIIVGGAGSTAWLDTSFGVSQASGVVLLGISLDLTNYRYCIALGSTVHPFTTASAWTGAPMNLTGDFANFLAANTSTLSDQIPAEVGLLYFTDEYLDLTDQDVMSRYVAQDGKPLDWGADGSLLTGTRPLIYQKGNASQWQTNLGRAPSNFVVAGGSITDV